MRNGQACYEAYAAAMGWEYFDRTPMPAWEALRAEAQRAWNEHSEHSDPANDDCVIMRVGREQQ